MNAIQRTWVLLAEDKEIASIWISVMNDLILPIPIHNRKSSHNIHHKNNIIEDDDDEDNNIDDV